MLENYVRSLYNTCEKLVEISHEIAQVIAQTALALRDMTKAIFALASHVKRQKVADAITRVVMMKAVPSDPTREMKNRLGTDAEQDRHVEEQAQHCTRAKTS